MQCSVIEIQDAGNAFCQTVQDYGWKYINFLLLCCRIKYVLSFKYFVTNHSVLGNYITLCILLTNRVLFYNKTQN